MVTTKSKTKPKHKPPKTQLADGHAAAEQRRLYHYKFNSRWLRGVIDGTAERDGEAWLVTFAECGHSGTIISKSEPIEGHCDQCRVGK